MEKYAVKFTVEGSGRQVGGLCTGEHTRVVEADSMSAAISKLKLGADCIKLEIFYVQRDIC